MQVDACLHGAGAVAEGGGGIETAHEGGVVEACEGFGGGVVGGAEGVTGECSMGLLEME